jgi:hypothetical protein
MIHTFKPRFAFVTRWQLHNVAWQMRNARYVSEALHRTLAFF